MDSSQRIWNGFQGGQLDVSNYCIGFFSLWIVASNQLGIQSFSDFIAVWGEGSEPFPGQIKYTFWHVFLWSWFCNAAMHIGMSDLSVFRYAKSVESGWTTAAGMYIGHYVAWIAACLLYAVYIKSPEAAAFLAEGTAPPVAPGPLAYNAIGWFGIIAVILAGWTLPTLPFIDQDWHFRPYFLNGLFQKLRYWQDLWRPSRVFSPPLL